MGPRILLIIQTLTFLLQLTQTSIIPRQDKLCTINYDENESQKYIAFYKDIMKKPPPKLLSRLGIRTLLYSGFKFQKYYEISMIPPIFDSYLKMTYCLNGQIQWERLIPLRDDIDWDTPICVNCMTEMEGNFTMTGLQCFKLARRKKYVRREFSLFFPGSWVGGIFYCQFETDFERQEALKSLKKNTRKFQLGEENMEGGGRICKRNNSIPLMPIYSDDYGNDWFEFEKVGTKLRNLKLRKFVPYLNTPNIPVEILNSFFQNVTKNTNQSKTITKWERKGINEKLIEYWKYFNNIEFEPWYNEIDVEENYDLTLQDYSILRKIMDKAINKFASITSLPQMAMKKVFSSLEDDIDMKGKITVIKPKFRRRLFKKMKKFIWRHLSIIDKRTMLIHGNIDKFKDIQKEWDNVNITKERYEYI
ncbi:uncharacterized protein NDAI_0I00890 [Naumovozyma dairenensis CBS 421]|uniref:Uncharacterized protein n=1 Tax=Naumovozyma dairenensis (strain ATCC 10597 / BCRC 20456 / CBS 421 / NBRC 0211 / NRRL Y-12639) TaxID=1071378 RepID=G0WFU7_NAUDC|nr:hypothetical protein NDAI_0I00890 [Naumovozyma dairenensis CBS 421]CCD26658.1 hypothetical protein NDAI_0I00890 [Naumovozyma dairenensis CBS 421]